LSIVVARSSRSRSNSGWPIEPSSWYMVILGSLAVGAGGIAPEHEAAHREGAAAEDHDRDRGSVVGGRGGCGRQAVGRGERPAGGGLRAGDAAGPRGRRLGRTRVRLV